MTTPATSSRRSFLKSSVLMAPLVAAPAAASAADGSASKLARVEAEGAIRALHADWVRRINTGDSAGAAALLTDRNLHIPNTDWTAITSPADAAPAMIQLSDDGLRASARHICTIERATPIPIDGTFAMMAHAQGGGYVHSFERTVMTIDYVRRPGGWAIAGVGLTAT